MSLVDYSDLKDDIENAAEPKVLPAGTEVKARIINVRSGISDKNDCPWFSPVFDVPAEPMAKEFNDFFWELQRDKLTAKEFERAKFQFKSFATAFGIDYARPLSLEDDLPGKEGYLIVGVRKDDTYGEQNTVRKYVSGK